MKRLFRLFSVTLISLFVIPLFACTEKGSVADYKFFNTNIHVETYGKKLDNDTNKKLKDLFSSSLKLNSHFSGSISTSQETEKLFSSRPLPGESVKTPALLFWDKRTKAEASFRASAPEILSKASR